MLVVTDAVSRYSWSFQIAADGTLVNGEPFYRLELPETTMLGWQSGTRARWKTRMAMVYFATPLGIQISMQNGRVAEILNPPDARRRPLIARSLLQPHGDSNWLYVARTASCTAGP